ncbi:FAD-dependent oxidoreductase [Solirubrobacter soli]|uniref:FAD-dependent oxidoreductase n=1 Tax=Solirubrobacter soli TaxID=363832 RepID=UPI0004161B71|nr:FAD-dependent oxidoreductase [Solirubrobacter soli]
MPPKHIIIAGGGVAAVEAVAALRALAGPLPRITLIAPEDELPQRAASVAAPFGFGVREPIPFDVIRRHARFDLHRGVLARVEPDARVAVDATGEPLHYDKLLIAVGAVPKPALDGAITFRGARDAAAVEQAMGDATSLAFVLTSPSDWALPLYELAIMAAVELRDRGREPEITVVTAEPAPLWVFGEQASAAITELLAERGITVRAGVRPIGVRDGHVELEGGARVPADAAIALPRLFGPAIPGLPHAPHGFIPVDGHGRVSEVQDVFAAGDATTFPLKQGGLATQQADAAAEVIAAELGAAVSPVPFRPMLRGLLLTGGAPLYLRSSLTLAGQPQHGEAHRTQRRPEASVSRRALWWPPTKIAGRYLAPLLATARPPLLATAQLQDLVLAGVDRDDRDDAQELALLLAEEEAAMGDYGRALQALDAAAALTGGIVAPEWARRREAWTAARAAVR